MSQAKGTLEVRKCGLCKRGGGFTKVCSPLSYNTKKRIKNLPGSNPFIDTDVVKNKCIRLTQPCLNKKKKKWPIMRGNSSQTSDIISKDKATQFPDDLIHNIQKIEVVEYEVTKETGEVEVIVTKTESLTRFISTKDNDNKDLHTTESVTKFDGTGKEISKELVTLYEPNPSFNDSADKMETAKKNDSSPENAQLKAKYTTETSADSQSKKTETVTTFNDNGKEISKRNRVEMVTTLGDTEKKPKVSLTGPIVKKPIEKNKRGSSLRHGKSLDSVRSIILRNLNNNIPRSGGGKIASSIIATQNKFSVRANIDPEYKCCRKLPSKRKSIQSSQVEVLETVTPLISREYDSRLTNDQEKRAPHRISGNVRASTVSNDRSTIGPAKSRNSARDTAQINSSENWNNDHLTTYRKERKTSGNSPLEGSDNSATNQSKKRLSENAPTPKASRRTSNNDTAANIESSYNTLTGGTRRRSSERSPPKVESQDSADENPRGSTESMRALKNSQTNAELSQPQGDSSRKNGTAPNTAENTASSTNSVVEKAKNTVTITPPKIESPVVSNKNSKIEKESKRASLSSPRKKEPTDIPNDSTSGNAGIYVKDQQKISKSNSQRNSKDMPKQEKPLDNDKKNDTAVPAPAVIKTRVYTETREVTNDEAGNVIQSTYKVESESDTEVNEPPIPKKEPEEQPEEEPEEQPEEEPEDIPTEIKPIPMKCNNCCRGSPCSNSCGYRCPYYYPMCCMYACNNCMTYPVRPKCNGACCSRNCGASSNCCHSRNH